jgi:hypothetical protein
MKYTGQTGRPFRVRLQEHLRDFKYGKNKSKFAQHRLENIHSIGPMENIIDTIHITKQGRKMDKLESFYIYRETKLNNQINDRLTVKPNAIFEAVVRKDSHRGYITHLEPDNPHTTQSREDTIPYTQVKE